MQARRAIGWILAVGLLAGAPAYAQDPSVNLRRTPTVEVVEKTKNAVVYISSLKLVAQRINPFGADPFFQQFDFGTQVVPGDSLGSGFIVHADGYIVTNNHVIDRARQISVQLLDGRKYNADVISANPAADLAILKIQADAPLPTLELGDSSDLMVGEPVIAVGNPLRYSHTVSTGIVSAVHRDLTSNNNKSLADLIQTDAAINPGNSGGPLLNAYGQVIGINTAIRGDAQNIGFAIQVNRLRDLIPDLMKPSLVSKTEIPLALKETRTLTPPAHIATALHRASDDAVINTIAGVKPKDIVDAYAILLRQKEGQPFKVAFEGKPEESIEPKPAAPPDAMVRAQSRLGLTVEPVTPILAQRMNLSAEDGMLVREVIHGSTAERIGLQPGDIIVSIGNAQIRSMEIFAAVMDRLPASGAVTIGILRGSSLGYGTLQL